MKTLLLTLLGFGILFCVPKLAYATPTNSGANPFLEHLRGESMKIKSIILVRFTNGRNGKNFDKSSYPDPYFKLFDIHGKGLAKSEVKKDAWPNRLQTYTGKDLPFLLKKNSAYILKLFDHDPDGRVKKNKDEEMSSNFYIGTDILIADQGKKTAYTCTDARYRDVKIILHVEWVSDEIAAKQAAYVPYIKSMNQYRMPGSQVYEGCGPVAAAMLMGYWQTQKGYKMMNPADRFDGIKHPTQTILDFRRKSDTRTWGNSKESATRKMNMKDALQHYVGKANAVRGTQRPKLKVGMLWSIRRWSEKRKVLHRELSQGAPVILLLKKLPPCLRSNNRWKNATAIVADHYVVANGFNDAKQEYYILPGWSEQHKQLTSSPDKHKRGASSLCKCTYSEISKADPSLIWISR